jgi:uncharacterized membrane protein YkoI
MFAHKAAILAFAIVIGMTGFASADKKDAAQREAVRQAKVSLSDAIAIAQRQIPGGQVVETDVETVKGVVQYAIKIDKDGLQTVFVDLQTGNVIGTVSKKDDDGDDDDDDD